MTHWRTGKRNPHTLYRDDEPAGFFLRPEDARAAAHALNASETARDLPVPRSPDDDTEPTTD